MLWDQYVFRRGYDANELWDRLFEKRPMRLLYVAGAGFDVRAQVVMRECVKSIKDSGAIVEQARLVLIDFASYELDESLQELTRQNAEALSAMFSSIGSVERISFGTTADGEELSASSALRVGTDAVVRMVGDQTDIILDAS